MSKWMDITDKSDIDIEEDQISIWIMQDYDGAVYSVIPLDMMKAKIAEYEKKQKEIL
jgi:hypothetical protein